MAIEPALAAKLIRPNRIGAAQAGMFKPNTIANRAGLFVTFKAGASLAWQ